MSNNIQKLSSLTMSQTPEELFLILGQIKDPDVGFNPVSDAVYGKRIPAKEKCMIAKNNIWQSKTYNHVGSINNYYVLNSNNNIVYLCISNNKNNNENSNNISSIIPNHTTPTINQLSDGYSWLPLYKIDPSKYQFITNTDLPTATISVENEYNSFSEKYKPLCGSGITNFGCCCLYFKENNTDEITQEIYKKGDQTNEIVFSDCYECQKLADSLDREVLFLEGLTAGSITSSSKKNLLCPSTKLPRSILEKLDDNKYKTIPTSSNAFAYNLLNTFDNFGGIMFARINLDAMSDLQKTISIANPIVDIIDTQGSGAIIKLNTFQINQNTHKITGIEIISRGSGYTELPDFSVQGISSDNIINSYINIGVFPESIFVSADKYVLPISYKIKTTIKTDELSSLLSTNIIDSFAILANPEYIENNSKVKSTTNNNDYFSLETRVVCGLSGATPSVLTSFVESVDSLYTGPSNFKSKILNTFEQLTYRKNSNFSINNNSKNNYYVYASGIHTTVNETIKYNKNSNDYNINGIIAFTTDTETSVVDDDILAIKDNNIIKYYNVILRELPRINKTSGTYVSSGLLANNITNKTLETTKSYAFNINIDIVDKT